MLYEMVKPKNTVILLAGLIGMTYERLMVSLREPVEETQTVDDLTAIDGIGPAFARRLNEAGVYTYDALARMTSDEVRSKAKMQSWQGEPETWIAEARELSARE